MAKLRIKVDCTEFGLNFTAGQIDPPGLNELQELAMVLSNLGEFIGGQADVSLPLYGVMPITSVMLANPAAYGLNRASAVWYEAGGMRYFWDATQGKLQGAGGFDSAQAAAGRALVSEYGKGPGLIENVLVIGNSLEMRGHPYFTGITVASVAGTDVRLTHANQSATVGDRVRLYNQANKQVAYTDATVLANDGAGITLRFPFNVSGKVSGSTSYFVLDDLSDNGVQTFAKGLLAKQGRFVNFYCGANGGATTSDVIAGLPYLPDLSNFDAVLLGPLGINNLTSSDDPVPIVADWELICNYFLDRGKPVIAGTTWPVMSGDARDTAPKIAAIKTINDAIRAKVVRESRRMILWDGYAALKDPATEYALSGYLIPADVHQLVRGAYVAGLAFVNSCAGWFKRNGALSNPSGLNYRYVHPKRSGANLLVNPEFNGSGGTKTGGGTWVGNMPDGWVGTASGGTSTLTTAARADGGGNRLQIQKAATGVNSTQVLQDVTSRVQVGKRYMIGVDYQTLVEGTGHYARWYMALTVNGAEQRHFAFTNGLSYAQGGRVAPAGVELHLCSTPIVIPEGTTAVFVGVIMDNGASGSTQVEVGAPWLDEVTT